MKCKCCEKEITEINSFNGTCKDCYNEIMKRVKINEIANDLQNSNQSYIKPEIKYKNKSANKAGIFLAISLFFNFLGIFSILTIIYAFCGISESDEHNVGLWKSILMLILGILITIWQWFLAPTITFTLG